MKYLYACFSYTDILLFFYLMVYMTYFYQRSAFIATEIFDASLIISNSLLQISCIMSRIYLQKRVSVTLPRAQHVSNFNTI